MINLTVFSKDQLRKIARLVERETDLHCEAIKRFMQLYDGKITVEVVEKASDLLEESKKAAENLPERQKYSFRKEFIQGYKFPSFS